MRNRKFDEAQVKAGSFGKLHRDTSLGVRSVGGISGGFLGGLAWRLYHRLSLFESLRRLDIIAYAMPLAWMFGRLGCALAHDHRGFASTSWYRPASSESQERMTRTVAGSNSGSS